MTRNFKAFGTIFAVVLGMGAMMVSFASASGETFHTVSEQTIITGHSENNQEIVATAATSCSTLQLSGTRKGKTSSVLTVHPVFTECSSSLGGTTSIATEGCNFVFGAEVAAGGHGKLELECEGTHLLTVNNASCTIKFSSQTFGQGATYTVLNNTSKETTVSITATKMKVFEKVGPLCFVVGGEATYSGKAILKGYLDEGGSEGVQAGLWWE
jgi:hypothetical protein